MFQIQLHKVTASCNAKTLPLDLSQGKVYNETKKNGMLSVRIRTHTKIDLFVNLYQYEEIVYLFSYSFIG